MAETDAAADSAASGPRRKNDPDATRANIIAVATRAFAENGLSGARIDEIAAETRTSKRMIYYYFGDKEGLYRHVLEAAYARVRRGERALDLAALHPVEALRQLVAFTFTHHNAHPDFIRLVMIENIHHGRYLVESTLIQNLNAEAVTTLAGIYDAGCRAGVFRKGLEAVELHWLISALSFFNVSNRATFSQVFSWDQAGPEVQARLSGHAVNMVLRFTLEPSVIGQYCP